MIRTWRRPPLLGASCDPLGASDLRFTAACSSSPFNERDRAELPARADRACAVAMIQFDVFGRIIVVERRGKEWLPFEVAGDGKRRLAEGIVIPATLEDDELATWFDDLGHEYATAEHPAVRRV